MGVTALDGNNTGLNARAVEWARSAVVELIGRPHLDTWHQERLIPINVDLHMRMMPSSDNFVIKSAAPALNAVQENFKMVIQSVSLIIYTKQLTSPAHEALIKLLIHQDMGLLLWRVHIKHLSIPANQTLINFENVFTAPYRTWSSSVWLPTKTSRLYTREIRTISKILASTASN